MVKTEYFYALGRRKSSTARVRLYTKGKGSIVVNEKPVEEYFDGSVALLREVNRPFEVLEKQKDFDVSVVVSGGGLTGQAGAISLAIAKSLVTLSDEYKGTLKKADLLSRDPREKERKKFGLKGARKQRQFTKR